MDEWMISEVAYKNGYAAGKASAVEQVFEKLKVDLKGLIGSNYLDDLKEQYESEIANGTRN